MPKVMISPCSSQAGLQVFDRARLVQPLRQHGQVVAVAVDKAHAVAHITARLKAEHGEIVTFGMGDSRSDARFMADCDYAIVPRRTQLAKLTVEAL